jgi:hypothetical protein
VTSAILTAHVWLVASVVPLLVRIFRLTTVLGLVTPPRALKPYRGLDVETMTHCVQRRLARPVWMKRRACLRHSLVLFHFLRLGGRDARMHIAAHDPAADSRRLHAHAWVTLDDQALSPPPEATAVTLLIWPRA